MLNERIQSEHILFNFILQTVQNNQIDRDGKNFGCLWPEVELLVLAMAAKVPGAFFLEL